MHTEDNQGSNDLSVTGDNQEDNEEDNHISMTEGNNCFNDNCCLSKPLFCPSLSLKDDDDHTPAHCPAHCPDSPQMTVEEWERMSMSADNTY